MRKFFLIVYLAIFSISISAANDTLREGFENPPAAAKARTWWHWINGNVTRDGITDDLEAMKQVGIQEAQIFNVSLGQPKGPATYLNDEWLELFKFAATEAQRLDMELAFHNSPGWSSSGGPWVTPEYAMQSTVYTDTVLQGGILYSGQLTQPETRLDYYKDIAVFAFPKPQSNVRIDDLDIKNLSGRVRNHLAPDDKEIPTSALVRKSDIIDLTSKVTASGQLEWQVPEGKWVVLRLGHTPTGAKNRLAAEGGIGLECDKMSREALDVYWQGGVSPIIEALDTLIGSVVTNCLIDSYEVGTTNWTSGFETAFKQMRAYDCRPYLAALAGYYVESGEESERFLWDFRRTIGDLMAQNYYAYFGELCHESGMQYSVEPYWGPFDNMQVGATGDIVMCEFWSGNLAFFDSPKFVASIAKLNGNSIVGAESFTGMGGWKQHPAMLKSIGDMAWAQGINRFVFHSFVHQPWDVAPGLTLGPFGIDFNRHNTWWKQGKGFLDYIARSQFLLQQGMTVADVLVFTGEASPNDALLIPEIKAMGYDYDLIGGNMLESLTVQEGLITTTVGAQYSALVLPYTEWLRPETLCVIEKLAKAGAIILGDKPQKSPSLQNYPLCDQQLSQLATRLWDTQLVQEGSIIDRLTNGSLSPDFSVEDGVREDIDFIHRKVDNVDIYFVANARKENREERFCFRVSGMQPELWNAETGEVSVLPVWVDNGDGTTTIPLKMNSEEALFVVFRQVFNASEHLIGATPIVDKPKAEVLPELKIISAEYGTFLQNGLVDVTELVSSKVDNNQLSIGADRYLCDGDPAPGYKKELRVAYEIGGEHFEGGAMEHEHFIIDASSQGELTIKKAIFGKFERGVEGIPDDYSSVDVKDKIASFLESGDVEISVNDNLVGHGSIKDIKSKLHIVYTSNGEAFSKLVAYGETLRLSQSVLESDLSFVNGEMNWLTPYPGLLTYTTTSGKSKTLQVKSVPQAIVIDEPWVVQFSQHSAKPFQTTFDILTSWSESEDERICYYSGTATYNNTFELTKKAINSETSLELDLGAVAQIAEVKVNGKDLGILWRSPFRICLDKVVHVGENTLEVKITNLWPNRLIGDARIPADFKRRGPNIKQWPEWIENPAERPSTCTTLTAYRHWSKDDTLLPSGLLGSVIIRPYVRHKVKY